MCIRDSLSAVLLHSSQKFMIEGSGANMGTSQSDCLGHSMSRCPELYMELYNASAGFASVDLN
eukprot:6847210-Alexandrium_andersonii.AAC.1